MNNKYLFSITNYSFSDKIIFDENKIDIEKELSFFCVLYTQISKIKIKNLNKENKKIEIKAFKSIINLYDTLKYEDLLILEDKLINIMISLDNEKIISNECFDYWNYLH